MNAQEFIKLVADHKDMMPTSCPLRVAMYHHLELSSQTILRELSCTNPRTGQKEPCNPDMQEAAEYLELIDEFAIGVGNGWDMEKMYGVSDAADDLLLEFAGFLVATSFRPAPLLLTEGTKQ